MPFYRQVAERRGERSPGYAGRAQRPRDHGAGNRERGREVIAEVAPVLAVERVFGERNQRPPPPLDVVVAGYDVHGGGRAGEARERPCPLPPALPPAPREAAGDHGRPGPGVRQHPLPRLDLPELRAAPEGPRGSGPGVV